MNEPHIGITPELVIAILRRRRWVIMVPCSIALLAGIFLAIMLPRVFEAKTMILVEGQKVPENYVQSIVTEDTSQRIATISQQILSRTNLEKIIEDFNLFKGSQKNQGHIEDQVANLRSRISIEVIRDGRRQTEAFTIGFKGRDPEKVMRVANGLASYFIDENLKGRETQAIGTSTFLEAELETMRLKLEQFEEKMKNYRKTYMGELPEQLETNLRIIERLQMALTGRQQSLRDARTRLDNLNSRATNREPSVVIIGGDRRANEETASLEGLRSQLEAIQSRYTDKHPDIQRLKKQIAELEISANTTDAESAMGSWIPFELRQRILEANREIQFEEDEIEGLKMQIAEYQRRVENIPKREQEMLGLRRDYENVQSIYESLLTRKLEADIAVNMERKQKGEQFRIIDSARIPQKPIAPNLKKLFMLSIAAGLALGFGLALFLENTIPSYRRPDEIEKQFNVPVLVSIPQLMSPKQLLIGKLNTVASIAYSVVLFGLIGIFAFISFTGADAAIDALR